MVLGTKNELLEQCAVNKRKCVVSRKTSGLLTKQQEKGLAKAAQRPYAREFLLFMRYSIYSIATNLALFSHPVFEVNCEFFDTFIQQFLFLTLFRSIMSMLLNQEKARRQVHNDWFVVMFRLLLGLLFRKNIHCNTNMKKYFFDSFIFVEDRSI